MNFKKWLKREIKLYSSVDLTTDGISYLNILNTLNKLDNINAIEKLIRNNIKDNKDKEHFQYIYRQFLIDEGYIEDEVS